MSYGHWLKRDFYLRKTKKPFEHYNKVYGKDMPERQDAQPSQRELNPKPLSLLQRISTKGVGVGIVFLVAIVIALVVKSLLR
ncbi:hypothetical protein BH09BAC1_BH09BAC1_11750 [soil metagenome]